MKQTHLPIMPSEIIEFLCANSPSLLVDGTSGAGGHSAKLADVLPEAKLLAFERDPEASDLLSIKFNNTNVDVFNDSYTGIPNVITENKFPLVEAALFDLGLSSTQLDSPERGFSFRTESPLDMRFDTTSGLPASVVLRRMTEKQIADMIYKFGEEGRSRVIARAIKKSRRLDTTFDLAEAVKSVVKGNPVKPLARVFQAIRIHVNSEFDHLEKMLSEMHLWTKSGCRIAVLTFHSLEDRLIKLHFRDSIHFEQFDPPWMLPSRQEKSDNSRARSARLRLGVRK